MHKALTLIVLTTSLSSCGIQMPNWGLANSNSDPQYTVDQNAAANSVVEVQKSVERLPVKVVEIPTITGVGFSAVSIQPGKNPQSKTDNGHKGGTSRRTPAAHRTDTRHPAHWIYKNCRSNCAKRHITSRYPRCNIRRTHS